MSTLKVNTIQDASGGNASTSEQIAQGRCKVWMNMNGEPAESIRDSFNVSSFTDNGTGDFVVNFATAMANANYVVAVNTSRNGGGVGSREAMQMTTGIGLSTIRVGDNLKQDAHFFVAAFGDQ